MTPRTSTSTKDASYKVYCSRKVPQQAHFPHRRKTVRRSILPTKDVLDQRQMKFLPNKMKSKVIKVEDSEDEVDFSVEEDSDEVSLEARHEQPEERTIALAKSGGKKTYHDTTRRARNLRTCSGQGSLNRKREAVVMVPQYHRQHRELGWADDDIVSSKTSNKLDRISQASRRRQSTMTQFADGRRPLEGTEEPKFKPARYTPRSSLGKRKQSPHEEQRTLTQMIPCLRSIDDISDEDEEDTEDEYNGDEAAQHAGQFSREAITSSFNQQGSLQNTTDTTGDASAKPRVVVQNSQARTRSQNYCHTLSSSFDEPLAIQQSLEEGIEEEDEGEEYQPTQFVDAPVTRARRSPRRIVRGIKQNEAQKRCAHSSPMRNTGGSRFSLLSTPEKRRIRVVHSSQSPEDSLLSDTGSPQKLCRTPLSGRSANVTQPAETPSRRKRVLFGKSVQEQRPAPSVRKFRDVVQDSEDEDGDEELLEEPSHDRKDHTGLHNPPQANCPDLSGLGVGAETQALLEKIVDACAIANMEIENNGPRYADIVLETPAGQDHVALCPRVHFIEQQAGANHEQIREGRAREGLGCVKVKEEPTESGGIADGPGTMSAAEGSQHQDFTVEPANAHVEESTWHTRGPGPLLHDAHLNDNTPWSVPTGLKDETLEEWGDERKLASSHKSQNLTPRDRSTYHQHSADLDDNIFQLSQLSSSQPETQQSLSNKAEQQLQQEWFTFSQGLRPHPEDTSSMNVIHDKSSLDAAPRLLHGWPASRQSRYQYSQATTVDEVTPKKNRTRNTVNANTTPHREENSQVIVSPIRPPPLFIPSSFPSPTKARVDQWSSPVMDYAQDTYTGIHVDGSIEDFSIPPPPPVDDI